METIKESGMETKGITPSYDAGNGSMPGKVDQASMGAHDAIEKVSDNARPTMDRMAVGAHQAVDRIASAATQVAETLGVKGEQLKDIQGRVMEQCRTYVRANPVTSLGIALAAGYVLSRLISSR